MKFFRLIASLLLIATVLPDIGQTLRFIASADPCGKVICCCKEMCRMAQNKPKCHMTSTISCGVVSFNTAPTAIPIPERQLGMASVYPSLDWPVTARNALNVVLSWFYDSLTRSPSERPPTSLV